MMIKTILLFQKRAEDRLFTTSMAMNTLIDAFTVFDPATKKLQWVGSSGKYFHIGKKKNSVKA